MKNILKDAFSDSGCFLENKFNKIHLFGGNFYKINLRNITPSLLNLSEINILPGITQRNVSSKEM